MVGSIVVGISTFALIASICAVYHVFWRKVEAKEAQLREDLARALRSLIEPAGDNVPSPLAVYSDQVATILAARVVQQLKTAAQGVASGVAKAEQSEALGALATGGSPWLALLSGLLPKKFRNQLLSSPAFTGQLSLLGSGGNHETGSSSVRQRIQAQGGQT